MSKIDNATFVGSDVSITDKSLTKKIKDGGNFLDLPLLDHVIMLPEGSVSFADEGLL
ncbi:MAG: hypothetical protein JJE17_07835 [Peptostreptococcaceae bacterium]|nr:hypothetical protein [Peptostreptococcaceae bacterium]